VAELHCIMHIGSVWFQIQSYSTFKFMGGANVDNNLHYFDFTIN